MPSDTTNLIPSDITKLEKKLCATQNPLDRLPLLIKLSERYGEDDPSHALHPAQEALHIAKSLNDTYWIAQGYYAIGQAKISGETHTETLFYLKKAAFLFSDLQDHFMLTITNYHITWIYISIGCWEKALPLAHRNQQFFEQATNYRWLCRSLLHLGIIYSTLGKHSKSLRQFKQCLQIAEKHGYKRELAKGTLYTGALYQRINDFESQEKYVKKAMEIVKSIDGKVPRAFYFASLAGLYQRKGNFQKLEEYATEAQKLLHETGHTAPESGMLVLLAKVHAQSGRIEKAIEYDKQAIRLLERTDNLMHLAYAYQGIAIHYHMGKHTREALSHLFKGLKLIEDFKCEIHQADFYEVLATIYEDIGDTKNALKYNQMLMKAREEYAGVQKQRSLYKEELRQTIESLVQNGLSSTPHPKEKEMDQKEMDLLSLSVQYSQDRKTLPTLQPHSVNESNEDSVNISLNHAPRSYNLNNQAHKISHKFHIDLIKKYPELTTAELKVCSLIRMGLSSKEIANFLNVSIRTIDNHRQNIRKKFEMPIRSSLARFIRSIMLYE